MSPPDPGTARWTAATDRGVRSDVPHLDLSKGVVDLTAVLCDIESVSGDEARLCDAIEEGVRGRPPLETTRIGHSLVARTQLGRPDRVVLAGHIDTVPLARDPVNLPTRREDGNLVGRGTV